MDLNESDPAVPGCIKALLAQGPEGMRRAAQAASAGKPMPAAGLKLLPPVPSPEKLICVGLNYADHARETGTAPPPFPVIFNKFPTSARAHGDPIVLPAQQRSRLRGRIGDRRRDRRPAHRGRKARDHIAAYCCGNDVSARDWQIRKPGGQWLLGKSFDSFAPFGPQLVTADEIPDPNNLKIQLRLNGLVMQDSSTSQFLFRIEDLVAYVSQVCTLAPGDILFTGTPPGVGFAASRRSSSNPAIRSKSRSSGSACCKTPSSPNPDVPPRRVMS